MPLIQGPGGRLIGRGTWHTEEDEALKAAVKIHGTKSWAVVSTVARSPIPTLPPPAHPHARDEFAPANLGSAPSVPPTEADGPFFVVPFFARVQRVPGRTGKQCRERWTSKVWPRPACRCVPTHSSSLAPGTDSRVSVSSTQASARSHGPSRRTQS